MALVSTFRKYKFCHLTTENLPAAGPINLKYLPTALLTILPAAGQIELLGLPIYQRPFLPAAGPIEPTSFPVNLPVNLNIKLWAVFLKNLPFFLQQPLRFSFKDDSVELNYSYPPGEPQSALCYHIFDKSNGHLQSMII